MIHVDGNGFEHSLQSTKEKNELGISYRRNTEYKGMAVVSQFQITAKSIMSNLIEVSFLGGHQRAS